MYISFLQFLAIVVIMTIVYYIIASIQKWYYNKYWKYNKETKSFEDTSPLHRLFK